MNPTGAAPDRLPGVVGSVPLAPAAAPGAPQGITGRPGDDSQGTQQWTPDQWQQFQSIKDSEVRAAQAEAQRYRQEAETARQQAEETTATHLKAARHQQLTDYAISKNYGPGEAAAWADQVVEQEFQEYQQHIATERDAQSYRAHQARSALAGQLREMGQEIMGQLSLSNTDMNEVGRQVLREVRPDDPTFEARLWKAATAYARDQAIGGLHQQATSTLARINFPGASGAQGGLQIPDPRALGMRRGSKEWEQQLAAIRRQIYSG
jgi:hypothetical protein